jgi:putative tricarboxylic transport membrane protein
MRHTARTFVLLLLLAIRASAQQPLDRLTIIAPAAPGGGWDQTARVMAHVLESEGLVRVVQVENVPGAAGTIGLAQFVKSHAGDDRALLVTGLVMVGAIVFNASPVSLSRTTPVARLTGDYEVLAVPASSPIRDVRDLVDRFRANPATVSWGGGSAGGTDHILAGLIANAAGVDPRRVNYIAFAGGGEALAAVLGGQVTVAISGYSEFAPHIESGRLRALAVSTPSAVPGINARPLRDYGLDVSLANWRAVVAPPGISEDAQRQLAELMGRMTRTVEWQRALRDRGWTDLFASGPEFVRFLDGERVRVARIARDLRRTQTSEHAGSARLFPNLILGGFVAIVIALMCRVRLQTNWRARQEPDTAGTTRWRSLGLITVGLVSYVALLRAAGFIFASTALFFLVSVALDDRHRVRDLGIALGFSIVAYAAFTNGLHLSLPAGWFGAWGR